MTIIPHFPLFGTSYSRNLGTRFITCRHQSPGRGAHSPMLASSTQKTRTAGATGTQQTVLVSTFTAFVYTTETNSMKVTQQLHKAHHFKTLSWKYLVLIRKGSNTCKSSLGQASERNSQMFWAPQMNYINTYQKAHKVKGKDSRDTTKW